MTDLVGTTLKGWRLDKRLGKGPLTTAYEATAGADRGVVKVLDASVASDEKARAQFLRAAYAANRFSHPRVVSITQDGADKDATFVVRPWQDARTLAEVVEQAQPGEIDDAEVLRFAEQVLDALEMAHAHGIVHGAISPTNVLVTPKRSIRLVDFALPPGAAGGGGSDAQHEDVLAARRAGPFTAPERCASPPRPATDATDVWSLAACMYFALTKKPPRDAADPPTTAARPLREVAPEVGEAIAAIVDHALQVDSALRYDSAYAMLGDVRRAMAGRKPKLTAALRPVPSGSYRELPMGTQASSRSVAALPVSDIGGTTSAASARKKRQKEWRGNVALILAIAFLVGVATFVMVREKRSDEAPPPPPPQKMYH